LTHASEHKADKHAVEGQETSEKKGH